MSQPGVIRELFVPGRLVANPDPVQFPAGSYPYDGTALGRVVGPLVLVGSDEDWTIEYEAEGVRPIETYDLGAVWTVGVVVRGLDKDAAALVMSASAASTIVGLEDEQSVISENTSLILGVPKAPITILFVPDNPDHHKALYCYSAVPQIAEGHQIKYRRNEELSIGIGFLLQMNASRQVWKMALIEEL